MTSTMPPRGQAAPPEDDWEAEQEVDFRRYWDGLVARWWLALLGLVLGAIVGYAISLGGGQRYESQATIYLGQPYSVSGNIQLQGLQTNPSTVRTVVNSQQALADAAKKSGLKQSALRGHIAVSAVSGNLARLGQTPLVNITVRGARAARVRKAANALAQTVIARAGGFGTGKVKTFQQQIAIDRSRLKQLNAQLLSASQLAQQAQALTDRLYALNLLSNTEGAITNLQSDVNNLQQLLSQTKLVEVARVVTYAGSQKVTARSRRNSVVVAAIVGLILGIAAALVWEGVTKRTERRGGSEESVA
jgi:uncharacterized protein involved in exopolysaccharide biosynthesis